MRCSGTARSRRDTGLERVAAVGSGVVYAGLCAIAVEILLGSGSSGSGNASSTTAGVFGWPGGTWLVGIAGAVLVGIGLFQGYRGLTKDFLEDSKTEQMSARVRNWIAWIGSFGHLARMVVFGLVGVFLIKAAVDYNPNKAVGLDGALAQDRPHLIRPVPARDHGRGAGRLRRLLAERRPVPPHLAPGAGSQRATITNELEPSRLP
jgi:Domain of Unknown Function (DUF1206)